jgi:hypothetical protein
VHLAFGLMMTLGSVYVFWELTEWEAHPDEKLSMPWPAALLYRLGRKWLLSALVLAVGPFLTIHGLRQRRIQKPTPPADAGA